MNVQGKFKMEAHKTSGVVMDIAAFKVRNSDDIYATTLRSARTRSSFMGAMDSGKDKFKMQATH